MSIWYGLLSKDQRDNIYKNQKRQTGKYFALWSEFGHLNKFMVTLSPSVNTLDATIELRRNFFKQLNQLKYYHKYKVAYFSAIEIKMNKDHPSPNAQITEETRMRLMQKNFHIHVQLLTDMEKADLNKVINKIDPNLCDYSKISAPTHQHKRYDYVIKDIKTIDWKLQYILKSQYKGKILYTSSRKSYADFIITKLWDYMKKRYKDKWSKGIKNKYEFVLDLKQKGDLVLSKNPNSVKSINMNLFDLIHIKKQGVYIYVKKDVL